MACCADHGLVGVPADADALRRRAELRAGVQVGADGRGRYLLSVPSVRCGQCIATIERALAACDDVVAARVNLTLRRVDVTLTSPDADPLPVLETLAALGYPATPIDATAGEPAEGQASSALLRAVAVAGFGAMNVMLHVGRGLVGRRRRHARRRCTSSRR